MFDSCEENKTSIRDLKDIEAFFEKGSTSLLTFLCVFIIIIIIVTRDHETFLHTIGAQPGPTDHEACRATSSEDVPKMYETQMSTLMLEYPFHIKFHNELGVDGGG